MKSAGIVLWFCLASKTWGKWKWGEGIKRHEKIEMKSLLLYQVTILLWFYSD